MRKLVSVLLYTLIFLLLPGITKAEPVPFELATSDQVAHIYYAATDAKLVSHAARLLAQDINAVTGLEANVASYESETPEGTIVLIGTLGQSPLIDQLADQHPELQQHKGDWERYLITTLIDPLPGVEKALVIVGSDRRGTAYGVFSISAEIGVSPWYWWADAPIARKEELTITKDMEVSKTPSVKYRGIFINDEAPALRNWAEEHFGGFNHQFYEKVFELILRNRGNYLWPAMWIPSAFAADDPDNLRLADEYGIVISTSHHEPMMRAHAEWGRSRGGAWNYESNGEKLREFWRAGLERMGDHEGVITLGMRGDGDEAMTEETAITLLEQIINDQREIIAEVSGKPVSESPQVWALYKEVQDYYDKGMRVADDIMLLFCDDNWGNVRILPKAEDLDRSGGFGIYYHFDFVGGPVSYRWLNVTQIEKVWEQMNLSYDWGVRDLWLVNVGDIKPMELPTSFFLDLAWDIDAIRADDLPDYYRHWAGQQFGTEYAEEIGEILALYTKYNARRTPEMLAPDTYSLDHYREAERVLADYQNLAIRSKKHYEQLPDSHRAAFYQLVLSPIEFCSNLYEMYVAAGKNKVYAEQGRAAANYYADRVREAFDKDAELTRYFHEELASGKWNHIMAQTHIGYRSWNNPPANAMPPVTYIHTPPAAGFDLVLEQATAPNWQEKHVGQLRWGQASFAPFDPVNDQHYFIHIFNRGEQAVPYSLQAKQDWIELSQRTGELALEEKILVSVDWDKVPEGEQAGEIEFSAAGRTRSIRVPLRAITVPARGFVENNGVVAIEASHFTEKHNAEEVEWTVVPNLGRTGDAVTMLPGNAARQTPEAGTPVLEYEFTLLEEAPIEVASYLSPSLNYQKNEGLQFALSIDGGSPQIINMHAGEHQPDWEYPAWWNNSVTDHIKIKSASFEKLEAGQHTLKVWMVDPGVVFQKFVIDAGGLLPSYLGPPESVFIQP